MLGTKSQLSAALIAITLVGAGCASESGTPVPVALSEIESAAEFEFKSFNASHSVHASSLSHDVNALPEPDKIYISFWAGQDADRFQIGLTSVAGFLAMSANGGFPLSHQSGHDQVEYQIYGSPIAGQVLTGSIAR